MNVNQRTWLLTAASLALLAISVAAAVTIGTSDISPVQVIDIVRSRILGGNSGLTPLKEAIIWDLRLPRTLLAAMCGAGLAMCGVILQSLLRNPLADPFILGISSGASTGAVLVIILGIGAGSLGLAGGAFIGALVAFSVVLLLAAAAGGTTDRVVLAGVAGTQLFSALTSAILFTAADAEQTRGVLFWLLGSLSNAAWTDVWVVSTVVPFGVAACFAYATSLDAFTFGENSAISLGVNVKALRLILLSLTALMTALIVSSAGAIGFVGLVIPHIARILVGAMHRRLIPISVIIGAIFLVWVDTVARIIVDPQELPVGVATALIGVPIFAIILLRGRRVNR